MQPGRRFVENEQISNCGFVIRWTWDPFRFTKMTNQLQPLRFATGQGIERLTQFQITETDFFEHSERLG